MNYCANFSCTAPIALYVVAIATEQLHTFMSLEHARAHSQLVTFLKYSISVLYMAFAVNYIYVKKIATQIAIASYYNLLSSYAHSIGKLYLQFYVGLYNSVIANYSCSYVYSYVAQLIYICPWYFLIVNLFLMITDMLQYTVIMKICIVKSSSL